MLGTEGVKWLYEICLSIGVYSNTYELICFKLGLMLDMTDLYIFVK